MYSYDCGGTSLYLPSMQRLRAPCSFNRHSRVRVVAGPLKGTIGTVLQLDGENHVVVDIGAGEAILERQSIRMDHRLGDTVKILAAKSVCFWGWVVHVDWNRQHVLVVQASMPRGEEDILAGPEICEVRGTTCLPTNLPNRSSGTYQ